MKNYYDILGVANNATPEQIKKAYRKKVTECHPDVTGKPEDATKFRNIKEAYDVLSDATKRAKFDADFKAYAASDTAIIKYVNPKYKKFAWKKAVAGTLIAAGLLAGAFALGHLSGGDRTPDEQVIVVDEESEELAADAVMKPEWAFNPNSAEEMTSRISNFILDAYSNGIAVKNDITGEMDPIPVDKAIDLYIWLNIDELTPEFLGQLNYQTKTEESISRSVEFIGNLLKEDTMTSRPDTIVNLMEMSANKKDAASLRKLQSMIADWNAAELSEKSALADELNAYINDVYLTDSCREYGYTTNVVALTFLRGMEIMSINSGNPIPEKDVANILYYDGSSLCLQENAEGKSKYSQEWTVAKEVMEKKLSMVVYTVDGDLGYKVQYAIMAILDESNIEYTPNPDINAERDKNDTTVYADQNTNATPLDRSKDKVVTDPKTGEQIVVQPQTPEQKQEQQEQIQNNLERENEQNTAQAQIDAQAGADAGFKDGFGNGQVSNPKANLSGKSQAYIDGYNTGYNMGAAELKKFLDAQNAPEEVIEEQFVPVSPSQAPVSPAPSQDSDKNNNSGNVDLLPGFHYGPDGKIYDENGNEVEIIAQSTSVNGRNVQIQNLVALKNEAILLADGTLLEYQTPTTVVADITGEKPKAMGIKI